MGSAMALRVIETGGAVVAFDTASEPMRLLGDAGATLETSPGAVARRCDAVSVIVNDDAQARAAVTGPEGILDGAAAGAVVAIHSTIHVTTLEELAAAGAAKGVTIVDAAVTGGPDAARRGELAVMLGGDPEPLERLRPSIERYASLVVRVGGLGAGMAAKIALMVVSFVKLAAAAEGLALARAAGVDLDEFVRIVTHSEAHSGIHDFFLRARRELIDDPTAPLAGIARVEEPKSRKDLHAALELAARHGIALPVTAIAHDAMAAVWGGSGPDLA
jgi:3-hydroxyisobutyrate dehydrogenase-like beta-hydroxyacid dehydrogenase